MIKNCLTYSAALLLFLTAMLPAFVSCKHEPAFLDGFDTICFDSQILPVMQISCGIAGCHDAGSASEGFIATNYESVSQAVVPGDVRGSLLYQVITDINGESMMPPDQPLSKAQRMLIEVWIAQGSMNTVCETVVNPPEDIPDSDTLCFVQDILPVFLSSCGTTGCHDVTSHVEGYIFVNYNTIMQKSESIVPFYPFQSKVYEVVTQSNSDDRMPPPPASSLTSEQINSLRKWIESGALNSDCPVVGCDTNGLVSFSGKITPLIQTNCVSCHNTSNSQGGVNLNGYQQVKYYADLKVNNISLLAGVIGKMPGFSGMPPTWTLSDCSKRQIVLWIEQGKLDN